MDKNNYVENVRNLAYILFLITFVSGFLIWHIFLDSLGFEEIQLFHSRYILTGAVYLLQLFIILIILYSLFNKMPVIRRLYYWIKSRKDFESLMSGLLIALLVYMSTIQLFTYYLFPRIDSRWGGGRPRLISLIADQSYIEYLGNFGIQTEKNSGVKPSVQTINLCIGYENNDNVLLLLPDRIISINKDDIKGFGSLPTKEVDQYKAKGCVKLLNSWINKTQTLNKQI